MWLERAPRASSSRSSGPSPVLIDAYRQAATGGPTSTVGGVVVFQAAAIAGAGGTNPTGLLTYTLADFIGAPTTCTASGTRNSGSLAGYTSLGIATFTAAGVQMNIALRVPDAEVRASPQTAYWSTANIPVIFGSGSLTPGDAFAFSSVSSGGFTTHKWEFAFVGVIAMTAASNYTATFT